MTSGHRASHCELPTHPDCQRAHHLQKGSHDCGLGYQAWGGGPRAVAGRRVTCGRKREESSRTNFRSPQTASFPPFLTVKVPYLGRKGTTPGGLAERRATGVEMGKFRAHLARPTRSRPTGRFRPPHGCQGCWDRPWAEITATLTTFGHKAPVANGSPRTVNWDQGR